MPVERPAQRAGEQRPYTVTVTELTRRQVLQLKPQNLFGGCPKPRSCEGDTAVPHYPDKPQQNQSLDWRLILGIPAGGLTVAIGADVVIAFIRRRQRLQRERRDRIR